jgi:peroxidase
MELQMKNNWWINPLARKPKTAKSTARPLTFKLLVEQLEKRCLLSVTGFRTIDGTGNNIADPDQGAGITPLLRQSPVAYADGHNTPSLPNSPGARVLSNDLNNQSTPIFSFADNNGNGGQSQHLSDFSYVWGQFTDHDLDLTLDGGTSFPIPADGRNFGTAANPIFDPMGQQPFTRSSHFVTDANGVRQQVNENTSFEDLSQVYGSTVGVASALRTHSGGHLKTSPGDLLPLNNTNYFTPTELATIAADEHNVANDAHQVPDDQLFVAGDKRANENIELTAIHTVFMRNHNRLANQLHAIYPSWTDEQLYQEARKINIAETENVTYGQFLSAIFGANPLPAYTGYHSNVDPSISTEFSTVGFRFGHTLLSNAVGRLNNDGTQIADNPSFPGSGQPINLAVDFFRPDLINANHVPVTLTDLNGATITRVSSSVGEIMKADASNAANEMDLLLIDEIRNILFGVPFGPGTDLAARDVQRARDHGIGTYNQVRGAFGLAPVTSYAQISSDPAIQAALATAYGPDSLANANKIDPFEGMLAEDHIPGTDTGPTMRAIVLDQFKRLRDGDRFFYLNESFNATELALFHQGDSLTKIIQNNTSISNLQADAFFFREEISGAVFNNPEGDGVRHAGDAGIEGVTVNLNDAAGNFIASAVTDVNGEYDFTDNTGIPGTGNFTLSVVLPPGYAQNDAQADHNPGVIHMSRGDLAFDGRTFALLFTGRTAPGGAGGGGAGAGSITPVDQAVTGSPTSFTVVAPNASDHSVTDTGTIQLRSSDDGATLPVDYSFSTVGDQTPTVTDVAIDGTVQFTVL